MSHQLTSKIPDRAQTSSAILSPPHAVLVCLFDFVWYLPLSYDVMPRHVLTPATKLSRRRDSGVVSTGMSTSPQCQPNEHKRKTSVVHADSTTFQNEILRDDDSTKRSRGVCGSRFDSKNFASSWTYPQSISGLPLDIRLMILLPFSNVGNIRGHLILLFCGSHYPMLLFLQDQLLNPVGELFSNDVCSVSRSVISRIFYLDLGPNLKQCFGSGYCVPTTFNFVSLLTPNSSPLDGSTVIETGILRRLGVQHLLSSAGSTWAILLSLCSGRLVLLHWNAKTIYLQLTTALTASANIVFVQIAAILCEPQNWQTVSQPISICFLRNIIDCAAGLTNSLNNGNDGSGYQLELQSMMMLDPSGAVCVFTCVTDACITTLCARQCDTTTRVSTFDLRSCLCSLHWYTELRCSLGRLNPTGSALVQRSDRNGDILTQVVDGTLWWLKFMQEQVELQHASATPLQEEFWSSFSPYIHMNQKTSGASSQPTMLQCVALPLTLLDVPQLTTFLRNSLLKVSGRTNPIEKTWLGKAESGVRICPQLCGLLKKLSQASAFDRCESSQESQRISAYLHAVDQVVLLRAQLRSNILQQQLFLSAMSGLLVEHRPMLSKSTAPVLHLFVQSRLVSLTRCLSAASAYEMQFKITVHNPSAEFSWPAYCSVVRMRVHPRLKHSNACFSHDQPVPSLTPLQTLHLWVKCPIRDLLSNLNVNVCSSFDWLAILLKLAPWRLRLQLVIRPPPHVNLDLANAMFPTSLSHHVLPSHSSDICIDGWSSLAVLDTLALLTFLPEHPTPQNSQVFPSMPAETSRSIGQSTQSPELSLAEIELRQRLDAGLSLRVIIGTCLFAGDVAGVTLSELYTRTFARAICMLQPHPSVLIAEDEDPSQVVWASDILRAQFPSSEDFELALTHSIFLRLHTPACISRWSSPIEPSNMIKSNLPHLSMRSLYHWLRSNIMIRGSKASVSVPWRFDQAWNTSPTMYEWEAGVATERASLMLDLSLEPSSFTNSRAAAALLSDQPPLLALTVILRAVGSGHLTVATRDMMALLPLVFQCIRDRLAVFTAAIASTSSSAVNNPLPRHLPIAPTDLLQHLDCLFDPRVRSLEIRLLLTTEFSEGLSRYGLSSQLLSTWLDARCRLTLLAQLLLPVFLSLLQWRVIWLGSGLNTVASRPTVRRIAAVVGSSWQGSGEWSRVQRKIQRLIEKWHMLQHTPPHLCDSLHHHAGIGECHASPCGFGLSHDKRELSEPQLFILYLDMRQLDLLPM